MFLKDCKIVTLTNSQVMVSPKGALGPFAKNTPVIKRNAKYRMRFFLDLLRIGVTARIGNAKLIAKKRMLDE